MNNISMTPLLNAFFRTFLIPRDIWVLKVLFVLLWGLKSNYAKFYKYLNELYILFKATDDNALLFFGLLKKFYICQTTSTEETIVNNEISVKCTMGQ
jgi:hypothetical protein